MARIWSANDEYSGPNSRMISSCSLCLEDEVEDEEPWLRRLDAEDEPIWADCVNETILAKLLDEEPCKKSFVKTVSASAYLQFK